MCLTKWKYVFVRFSYDDVIKWKYFPHSWPFVWGIHQSPVNSSHKGQWCGALMFSLICAWIDRRLCKQSWGWWFETPLCSLWCHCNVVVSLKLPRTRVKAIRECILFSNIFAYLIMGTILHMVTIRNLKYCIRIMIFSGNFMKWHNLYNVHFILTIHLVNVNFLGHHYTDRLMRKIIGRLNSPSTLTSDTIEITFLCGYYLLMTSCPSASQGPMWQHNLGLPLTCPLFQDISQLIEIMIIDYTESLITRDI